MEKLFQKKTEHCCELMQHYLDEKKVGIYYDQIIRGYYICLIGLKDGKHVIYNCPWCGSELPNSLVDEYYDTLEKEYNILCDSFSKKYYEIFEDSEKYEEVDRELPEEFRSDEWWKKREL